MSRKSVAAQIEKRRSVVSANLLAGNTYRQIAAGLGVSIGTVSNDVKMLLRQWKRENIQTINDWKILAIERINRLIMAIWLDADKGDEGAIATFIKLEKRLSEIIGYDAPLVPDDAEIKVPAVLPTLPADVLSPAFLDVYRDIRDRKHVEYDFYGGRGSTKSSFVSLASIWLLANNPQMHMLAVRQVANTLRDSVYSQLTWAIDILDLTDKFRNLTSPLEITYLPTGQKIYFRGADDPGKIKSIKPPFGYIGIVWFEELDQFHGDASVRKIEQSAVRGGDLAYIFKSFNPPPTAGNWANKYIKVPKANRFLHHSDYRTVPPEWLGKVFIEEAEHLKTVNPAAYEHEYLGEPNAIGGMVFNNVTLRPIADEEIAQFDRICMGQDWGYYPDPAHWVRCHYDAARLTLYIFDEYRAWRSSNRDLYQVLVEQKGVLPHERIICDSAEPKSVADFREYGLNAYGAEKGPDSVNYSMKWLQSLSAIIIDNRRCPYTAEEFTNYEYEQTPDGEIINEYPDKNNHAIDSVRYATNLIWRVRGK